MGEAALYVRSHEALRKLYDPPNGAPELVERLLRVSRGHPLILDRLASLADDRPALADALDALETQGMGKALPDLFAGAKSEADREQERLYLEDIAVGAVDLLIERATPDARRLLWVITLANEPAPLHLLEGVWSGGSVEPLKTAPEAPPIGPLLGELRGAGLISREEPEAYSFHELVRERTAEWMDGHPDERGEWTEEEVWIAYGDRYAAAFGSLQTSGAPDSMEKATEAGRRAVSYLVRVRAFDRLGAFAGGLVTGTRDPEALASVIEELQAVADQVPPGEDRWSVRTYLADALDQSGRADESLPLYEQAAAEAEAAGHWSDVAWICHNWAGALLGAGQLDAARAAYLRSAETKQKAGSPRVNIVASELEALRIDVMQGRGGQALPQIDSRLGQVREWWRRQRAGESAPEAPDPILLGRALVSALDIARQANQALKHWQACLDLLGETEQAEREMGQGEHELAMTRFNQYGPLMRLGRLDQAQQVVESCLEAYVRAGDRTRQGRALSALANVWDERGDVEQAIGLQCQALALCNGLPDPTDRAISHNNLANYLGKAGMAEQSAQHDLAAGIYFVASGHGQHLSTWFRNRVIDVRRAAAAGGRYELPRVSDLLALPAFTALREFLEGWKVDVKQLQAQIDERVEAARANSGR